MKEENKIIVKRDVYYDNGNLLIAKGSELVLTDEKCKILRRYGKLEEVLKLAQAPEEKMQETPRISAPVFKIEEKTTAILQQKLYELEQMNKNISLNTLNQATDLINYLVFNCKEKDWSRFVHLLYSYVDWLYAHSINTAIICYLIGSKLGYDAKRLSNLCIAALLHDIGVTLLPKEILLKPEKLTDVEYTIIKNHSQMGAALLQGCGLDAIVPQIVLQHHERVDGSGYPYGLKEDQILEESYIVVVAEYFDTATTFRPYKNPQPVDEVLCDMRSKNNLFPEYIVNLIDG